MSSGNLPFYVLQMGEGQSGGQKGTMIGQLWPVSGGRLAAQLPPGCLADTGQTSLTNEGPCPVSWGNLGTSWPDVNEINLKFY